MQHHPWEVIGNKGFHSIYVDSKSNCFIPLGGVGIGALGGLTCLGRWSGVVGYHHLHKFLIFLNFLKEDFYNRFGMCIWLVRGVGWCLP